MMVIIETRSVTFVCGENGYYRVAYWSDEPALEVRLCGHLHEDRISASLCDEAHEKAQTLWRRADLEEACRQPKPW